MSTPTSKTSLPARLGSVLLALGLVLVLWHGLTGLFGIISPARFPMPTEVGACW